MSRACRRLQSSTQRLARAELRTEDRLCFCELPDSPDSSEYPPSSNESDEDDFDYGGATAYANQRNQVLQTDSAAMKNRSTSPNGKGEGKVSEQEKVTVAIVNIAKTPSEDYFRQAFAVRNFHEQPLESRGKPRTSPKEKGQRKESEQEKVTVATVSLACR